MRVTLVAKTEFIPPTHIPWEPHEGDSDSDALSEMSGRLCYLSWHRPNPKTATNAGYIGNIIDHEHFSVMEHSSATFLVEGVSRSLSLELIRHRHLSFSQVSQRYCKEDDAEMVVPPAISEATGGKDLYTFVEAGDRAVDAYVDIVEYLKDKGYSRKQAREAARAVLPNATETKIVVTGNMRAWRDVLKKRYSVHADAEIRALAGELLTQLRGIAPNSFQDIPEEPYK